MIIKAAHRQYLLWILLVALSCLPALWSLLQPGWFLTQDGDTLLIRLAEFHRMLRDGQIPVRYGTIINFAWGYPAFNFLYPLPMMTMEAFYLLGFGIIGSAKAWLTAATILSALTMFIWVRSWFGLKAGLAAAILYTYAPYRFLDLYVRGSVGEVSAFPFPPLVAFCIQKLATSGRSRYLYIGAVAWALLILAHNTLGFLFSIFLLFWLIYFGMRSIFKKRLVLLPILMLLLTTWFWLPIVLEAQYVQFNPVSVFSDHYIWPYQLVWDFRLPYSWGFEGSGYGTEHDGMSFQVGIVPWIAVILSFFSRIKVIIPLLSVFWVAIFLMLPWSDPFWQQTRIADFFQFPFRILALCILVASVLWGILLRNQKAWIVVISCVASILITLPYARSGKQHDLVATDAFYATNDGPTTITDEFMPKVVKEKLPARVYEEVVIVDGTGTITKKREKSNDLWFLTQSDQPIRVRINTIDYPGWVARIDGQMVPIIPNPRWGLIEFPVTPGTHEVRVRFGETRQRLLADGISAVSFLGIIAGAIKWRKYW